jgi:hypothetical protein
LVQLTSKQVAAVALERLVQADQVIQVALAV